MQTRQVVNSSLTWLHLSAHTTVLLRGQQYTKRMCHDRPKRKGRVKTYFIDTFQITVQFKHSFHMKSYRRYINTFSFHLCHYYSSHTHFWKNPKVVNIKWQWGKTQPSHAHKGKWNATGGTTRRWSPEESKVAVSWFLTGQCAPSQHGAPVGLRTAGPQQGDAHTLGD
jgi:hypothetical protein